MSVKKVSAATLYEVVAVPAVLMLGGYLVLRWLDGQWWGVLLWMLVAPVIYLLIDFLFFRASRPSNVGGTNRLRGVKSAASPASPSPRAPTPAEWQSAQDVSIGAEILRRGRRYDRRS